MQVLGLDIGTSAVKAALWDPGTGRGVSARSSRYGMDKPAPGWFEQDPAVWLGAVREAVAALGDLGAVDAVAFTGQMHGAVLSAADGRPVRPAMLWPDRRAEAEAAEIARDYGADRVYRLTGSPSTANYVLPKLLWLARHEPGALAAAERMLLPKDWVRMQLGGAPVTEPTDASGTGILDIHTLAWEPGLLGAVPRRLLPEIVPSASVAGRLNRGWAGMLGLREGTPLVAGAGDLPAAILTSTAGDRPVLNVGSAGQVAMTISVAAPWAEGVQVFCHPDAGQRIAVGALLAAGLAVAWARDLLAGARPWPPEVVPSAIFIPHLAGERLPSYDLRPRGAWLGLSLETSAEEMVSAALYGVAMAYREVLEHMGGGRLDARPLVLAEGAYAADWARRLAHTLGQDVDLLDEASPSALGACMLGAPEALSRARTVHVRHRPDAALRLEGLYRAFREFRRH